MEWVEIPLTRGYSTKVDKEDLYRVSNIAWTAQITIKKTGHTRIHAKGYIDGREIRLHRFLLNITDSKVLVDHINGDALDNRKCNLRTASMSENNRNRRTNTKHLTGFKGIHKKGSRWRAIISSSGKSIFLGSFEELESAIRAYDMAAIRYFGEFAYTNFPRSDYD